MSSQKKEFRYKLGLRQRDKKRLVEQALSEGILTKDQINNVIKEAKYFVKNRAKCYVCGKKEDTKVCSRCKNYHYCSREHQAGDWNEHRLVCHIYRYCFEDHHMYLRYDKIGKKPEYCPQKPIVQKSVDNVLSWDSYFFSLREKFFSKLFQNLKSTTYSSSNRKSKLPRSQWVELPEFRTSTKKLSLSLTIYYALQVLRTKMRNNVISLVIPYLGPKNVNVMENVKEICCLLYNVKSLGITFVGENLPVSEEISYITYDEVSDRVAIYFWKKKYDPGDMQSADAPDLVILESKKMLHELLEPVFDLLVQGVNILMLFNSYKYYKIAKTLIEDILGIRIGPSSRTREDEGEEEERKKKKKKNTKKFHGINPFMSYEFWDPCKKVKPEEVFSDNQYFILLSNYTQQYDRWCQKLLESKIRKYLSTIVERGNLSLEEIYIYMTCWKWGFCNIKDVDEQIQ